MQIPERLMHEWLETDGLGGFASATVSGMRSRRYHGILCAARTPPTERVMLVNGFEAWVETESSFLSLSTQAYVPSVIHPDGYSRIDTFSADPWPCWRYRLAEGAVLEHKIFSVHNSPITVLTWKLARPVKVPLTLHLKLLMSGRDIHSLHYKNQAFNFEYVEERAGSFIFQPYTTVPGVRVTTDAAFSARPEWYERFLYAEERDRGYDFWEDLASPGVFSWDLTAGVASIIISEAKCDPSKITSARTPQRAAAILEEREESRRRKFSSPLARAGDSYIVKRGEGRSIIAGYPWFTDWGRDTFISLRGLCIASGRVDDAKDILLTWAENLSDGMIPNVFPDDRNPPMFNAVDASLWFIAAVYEYFAVLRTEKKRASGPIRKILEGAVEQILNAYIRGTRYGIKCTREGLLNSGSEGVQLTWMDAKVNGHVVTPRSGKPVEIQALWLNALRIAGELCGSKWSALYEKGAEAFAARFWNHDRGFLFDVVDCNGKEGVNDPLLRPNQILAVGGLPFAILSGERAAKVVAVCEAKLLTPRGLRSLGPDEPGYKPHYAGGLETRDFAYHQGTVWPWLMGPFVEAWVQVNGNSPKIKRIAYERFIAPMLNDTQEGGIGHLSEIADAEAPYTRRGCPFQAWSVGELTRLLSQVLVGRESDDLAVATNGSDSTRSKPSKRAAQISN